MKFKNFILKTKTLKKCKTYYLFGVIPIIQIFLNDKTRLTYKILFFKFKIRKKKYLLSQNKPYEQGIKRTPTVISCEDSIEELLNSQKSIIRYGDGEFNIIKGKSIRFQEYNYNLKKELENLLLIQDDNIMVAIPDSFGNLSEHSKFAQIFWERYMVENRTFLYRRLNFTKKYYDAFVSRSYLEYLNNKDHTLLFKKLKEIWNNKDIVLVEGEFSRLGYNNDLFNNTKSIKRIICPAENAYNVIDKIINKCQNFSNDKLFIVALGPTATVLAYKLHKLGYRALDLGHIDIEYEWFLRKATKKIPIANKFVNEVAEGRVKTNINDEKYHSEIAYVVSSK